jgi:hypothetical protein
MHNEAGAHCRKRCISHWFYACLALFYID